MGFFHGGDRERLAQQPQQRESVMEPGQSSRPRLATQRRQQIPGVQRMKDALQQIAAAQHQMREATDGLRAVLSIAPLAKAYAEFQDQGGISASDWHDWLDGKVLPGACHISKGHLRLISSRIL